MKQLTIILAIVLGGLNAFAQTATTTEFSVGGIKVIFKPTTKSVNHVRIYFRGGVTNYPESKAGIEEITLYAMGRSGTQNYPANAFKDTTDKYGLDIYGESTLDYGFVQLDCISKYFNKGWEMFTETINNPTFEDNEVNIIKSSYLLSLKQSKTSPDNRLRDLQVQNGFANTAYATSPRGTEQSVSVLTPQDLSNYYKTLINKNKIFIVAVGNFSKDELYEKILLSFGNMPAMPYTAPNLTTPAFNDNKLLSEGVNLKIDYVSAIINAPDYTSVDYIPFRMAMSGVGGNLYQYLRSASALSNNPSAIVYQLKMPYAVISASSNNAPVAMVGMLVTLKDIQSRGYNTEWLQHIKNSYITNSFVNDQSAAQINRSLGLAEILGNWHYADNLPQLVNMVTVDQVNKVINTYIQGVRWNYLGKTENIEALKKELKQQ